MSSSYTSKEAKVPSWQQALWYQAATLRERFHGPSLFQAFEQADWEQGKAQLQFWQNESPLQQENEFSQRLMLDGLDEAALLKLLSEAPEDLHLRLLDAPAMDWLAKLQQAFETPQKEATPRLDDAYSRSFIKVVETVQPLLTQGYKHLQTGIATLEEQYQKLPFEVSTVAELFYPMLVEQIYTVLIRALILEMHIERLKGDLQGESSEERFYAFLAGLKEEQKLLAFLEEYPVLARQLMRVIDFWCSYSQEILTHLCQDWQDIQAKIFSGEDPGLLSSIKNTQGDSHRKGHRVIKLLFASGACLMYKPKALAVDRHFQEVLGWCNQQGETLPFRITRLLDRGTYGWSEYIAPHDCCSEAEIERFYERQGSYLALLSVLQATDLHAENVIAAGEQPMFVDLETLFHPFVEEQVFGEIGNHAIATSVLRVGLLPSRFRPGREREAVDLSGLGGRRGQRYPYRVPTWKAHGTDQMHIEKDHVEISHVQNQPELRDHEINPLNYQEKIISGFTKMYNMLLRKKEEFLHSILPCFINDQIRVVLRPTSVYGRLLTDMYHPDVQRNGLDAERVFDRLLINAKQHPHLKRVFWAERMDLLNGDIPLFSSTPASQALFTSHGSRIENFCCEPGIESAWQKIAALSPNDLDLQTWLIRASFATAQTENGPQQHPNRVATTSSLDLRQRLLRASKAIGDRLCQLAIARDGRATWIGLIASGENEWRIGAANTSLYSGIPGIALFLAYLGALTETPAYTDTAQMAIQTVKEQIPQLREQPQMISLGAFSGWGSLIYPLSHLGVIWSDPSLLQEAEQLVEMIPEALKRDHHFDIIAGAAGCIGALLSLYAVSPSQRVLEAAKACGQHLLEHAQAMPEGVGWQSIAGMPPLAGFSHGVAGIALSLYRLATASGDERFSQLARNALTYERSLFSPEAQNWLDLRSASERNAALDPHTMTAWCHGAPGIGLARLALQEFVNEPVLMEEALTAVQTTIASGFGWNHSLCHGDLGNIETLLMAAHHLQTSEHKRYLEQQTANILASIETDGWISSTPAGIETPGLMNGLAGIGYELLRLADPERVPSLLLLSPPVSAGKRQKEK